MNDGEKGNPSLPGSVSENHHHPLAGAFGISLKYTLGPLFESQ